MFPHPLWQLIGSQFSFISSPFKRCRQRLTPPPQAINSAGSQIHVRQILYEIFFATPGGTKNPHFIRYKGKGLFFVHLTPIGLKHFVCGVFVTYRNMNTFVNEVALIKPVISFVI